MGDGVEIPSLAWSKPAENRATRFGTSSGIEHLAKTGPPIYQIFWVEKSVCWKCNCMGLL